MSSQLVVLELSKRKLVHLLVDERPCTACGLSVYGSKRQWRGAQSRVTCPSCRRRTGMPTYVSPEELKSAKKALRSIAKAKVHRPVSRPARSEPDDQPTVWATVNRIRREDPELYQWCCYAERWQYVSYVS